ncbi:MAG: lamin tail domain-containing protein [Anaerolineales bacterium]|nr:lamin tail domain-containing protein [Anaerolineales bacterium]
MKTYGGYTRKAFLLLLGIVCVFGVGCGKSRRRISICDLQGGNETSPYFGQEVEISGIITADLEDQSPAGFFIQDVICRSESKIGISSGVFVLTGDELDQVSQGDEVSVRGIVVEYSRETILVAGEDSIQIKSVANPLPDIVNLESPLNNEGSPEEYEPWEGMMVSFPSAIVIGSSEERGNLMVHPYIDWNNSQYHNLAEVKGMLRIIQDQEESRLDLAEVGDFVHGLKGLVRQDQNSYILYLIEPDQVVLIPSKYPKGILYSADEAIDKHAPTILPTNTISPTGTPTPYPVHLLITELMPNPNGKEPDGEWIEIYNPEVIALPLAGIKLGDEISSGGKEGMFCFPDGYYIEANEVLVIAHKASAFQSRYGFFPDFEFEDSEYIVPDLFPYLNWASKSVQFSNGGDEALLLDPWDNIVDQISYGNSEYSTFQKPLPAPKEGHSLERYPPDKDKDQAGDWRERVGGSPGRLDYSPSTPVITSTPRPQPTKTSIPSPSKTFTPGIPSATPASVRLLINEIMVNPAGEEPEGEWIEILNPEDGSMLLTGVKIGDAVHPGDPEGMLQFPDGEIIEPGELIVVAYQAVIFESIYGFKPNYEMSASDPEVNQLVPYRSWAGGLIRFNNSGDELVLLDGWDEVVDLLAYGNSNYVVFQPPISSIPEGNSLARHPAGIDTDSAGDWIKSEFPSPGKQNPVHPTSTPTITPLPSLAWTPTIQLSPPSSPLPTTQNSATTTEVPTIVYSQIPQTPAETGTITIMPTIGVSVTPLPTQTMSETITPQYSATEFPPETSTMTLIPPTTTSIPGFIEDDRIIINEIHADPDPLEGDSNGDGEINSDDDEFLEFINLLETDLDLSGWKITDAVRLRFTFPVGTVLPAHCPLVLFGGGSPEGDFGGSLILTAGSLALNNSGDTISVWDQEDKIRLQVSFGSEGGFNQSLTRNPDLLGYPLERHSDIPAAENRLYSPGLKLNGEVFVDCP